MNTQKFLKENKLQNIEIQIGDNRESMESILERFQSPIHIRIKEIEMRITSIKRLMDTQPMSPMTEMEYKREIREALETQKTLIEL